MQRKLSLITALTAALAFPAAAYGWGEGHWGESNTQGPGYGGSGRIPPPSAHVPGSAFDKREKRQKALEAYQRWQQNGKPGGGGVWGSGGGKPGGGGGYGGGQGQQSYGHPGGGYQGQGHGYGGGREDARLAGYLHCLKLQRRGFKIACRSPVGGGYHGQGRYGGGNLYGGHGGVFATGGGGGARYWQGRWWSFGVGPCWRRNAAAEPWNRQPTWIWICR